MQDKRNGTAKRSLTERRLRRLEWVTVTLGLFISSGALFPLLLEGGDGMLDDAERAKLRLLFLPVYGLSLALLALRPRQLFFAALRNLPMTALLILPFVSVIWSISPSLSLRRAVALLLSTALAFLFATRFTPRQQIVAVGGVIGTSVALSLIAGVLLPHLAYMPEIGGLRGIFFNKNVLGWMSVVIIVVGLAARQDTTAKLRRLGLGLLVLGWLGCLLSTSVTSLLAGVAAVGISRAALMLARRRGLARVVSTFSVLLIALVISVAFAAGFVPLMEALGRDATLTGRVPLWELVDPEIARSPLLGYGYGAFWSPGNATIWQIREAIGWGAPHAHNGFRDLLLALGAVGLALFVVATAQALIQSITLCGRAPRAGWIWCVTFLGSALVMNVTESTILMQNDLLWILYATAVVTVSSNREHQKRPAPRFMHLAISAT